MVKIAHRIISLILLILITLLVLHYTNTVSFSTIIIDSISFSTLSLIIFSATSTICSKCSNFNKFINYLIIIGTFSGMLLYIIQDKFNYIIYATLFCTVISSLMDMFYKKV